MNKYNYTVFRVKLGQINVFLLQRYLPAKPGMLDLVSLMIFSPLPNCPVIGLLFIRGLQYEIVSS